jgi:hypothetical protein
MDLEIVHMLLIAAQTVKLVIHTGREVLLIELLYHFPNPVFAN